MNTPAQKKKIEEVKKDLFSGDDSLVQKAINYCREEGSAELVEPLITVFATTKNLHVKQEVGEMLSQLKVSNVEDAFMKAIKNPKYRHVRKQLLFFIWSSGIQPSNYLVQLTEIAIDGSYEEAVECLTIIEGLEDEIPESDILEASTIAREYISRYKMDEKRFLVADILVAIEGRQEIEE
ncbi:MAG: hypothetical protein R2809_07890 [Flavobacteriales bacterium]